MRCAYVRNSVVVIMFLFQFVRFSTDKFNRTHARQLKKTKIIILNQRQMCRLNLVNLCARWCRLYTMFDVHCISSISVSSDISFIFSSCSAPSFTKFIYFFYRTLWNLLWKSNFQFELIASRSEQYHTI